MYNTLTNGINRTLYEWDKIRESSAELSTEEIKRRVNSYESKRMQVFLDKITFGITTPIRISVYRSMLERRVKVPIQA
jgi:hypothetical protein